MYRVFIKYCVFFQEFSSALGCYWLYNKLPANRSDCTLALHWELYSDVGEGGVAVNCEKTHPVQESWYGRSDGKSDFVEEPNENIDSWMMTNGEF